MYPFVDIVTTVVVIEVVTAIVAAPFFIVVSMYEIKVGPATLPTFYVIN